MAADETLSDTVKTERMRSLWLDVYFPSASADPETARPALAETFADAEFRVFEASGHFAPGEEPEAFREAVFAFLGVED